MDTSQQQLDGGDAPDAGGIVLGWVTKLAVVTGIIAVLGFDAISVGVAHFTTADDASSAVQAASQTYLQTHNLQAAFNAAATTLRPTEALETTDFTVLPDGTVTLTVTDTAHTLLLYRTKTTSKYADVTASATGKYTG